MIAEIRSNEIKDRQEFTSGQANQVGRGGVAQEDVAGVLEGQAVLGAGDTNDRVGAGRPRGRPGGRVGSGRSGEAEEQGGKVAK